MEPHPLTLLALAFGSDSASQLYQRLGQIRQEIAMLIKADNQ